MNTDKLLVFLSHRIYDINEFDCGYIIAWETNKILDYTDAFEYEILKHGRQLDNHPNLQKCLLRYVPGLYYLEGELSGDSWSPNLEFSDEIVRKATIADLKEFNLI